MGKLGSRDTFPSREAGQEKGTPEIRVKGEGTKHILVTPLEEMQKTAEDLVTLDRTQRSLVNLLCLIFSTDLGRKTMNREALGTHSQEP